MYAQFIIYWLVLEELLKLFLTPRLFLQFIVFCLKIVYLLRVLHYAGIIVSMYRIVASNDV